MKSNIIDGLMRALPSRVIRRRAIRKENRSNPFGYQSLEPKRLLAADGVVVANYRSDFGSADSGWSYEYNITDAIHGDDARFSTLSPSDSIFVPATGSLSLRHLQFTPVGGHPGVGGASSRFAIATYTIPSSGDYELTDAFVSLSGNSIGLSDGVEFRVFVNDGEAIESGIVDANESNYFDVKLGFLAAGDKVRVAYGANRTRTSDFFTTDFSIRQYSDRVESIADYSDSIATASSSSGTANQQWKFYWNAPDGWVAGSSAGDLRTGVVGDTTSYRPLSSTTNRIWTADGDTIANSAPDKFLRFDRVGGHPGVGYPSASGLADRFVIAAHTVERSGIYAFNDSFLRTKASVGDGLELVIHVNEGAEIFKSVIVPSGTNYSFDGLIGNLKKGDTVYVAVGANESHSLDRFESDFSLVRVLPRVEPLRSLETAATNTFYVADYGAVVNDRQNDFVAISNAITAAMNATGPAKVVLQDGIYNVAAPAGFDGRAFFRIANAANLEIDGQGAKIIVDDFKRGLFQVVKSENVIFRNLEVDYAEISRFGVDPAGDSYRPNTFVQGTVSEIDRTNNTFILTIDPVTSVAPDETFVLGSQPDIIAYGYLLDRSVNGRLKSNSSWHYTTKSVTPLSSRFFRIEADRVNGFEDGDRYVIQRRVNVSAFGIYNSSKQVSLIDVDIFASPSSFVTVTYSESVNLIRSNAKIDTAAGRWKGINADAVHGQSMRTGFWVEESRFSGVGDDIMNFYSVPATPLYQNSENSLVMAFVNFSSLQPIHNRALEVGDLMKFVNPLTAELIQEARVVSWAAMDVDDAEHGTFKTVEVTFDQAINGITLGSRLGEPAFEGYRNDTMIYNDSYSNGFLVEGSRLMNSRRYGQFLMANNVQLVDNVYGGLSDSAIAGHNQSSWPLGLYSRDILVQNNRFLMNGFSNRYFSEDYFAGVVAFHADRYRDQLVDRADYSYANLTIVDNEFRGWGKTAIAVRNASDVEISRNRIFVGLRNPVTSKLPVAMDIQFTKSVLLEGNELFSSEPFLNSRNNLELIELENDAR